MFVWRVSHHSFELRSMDIHTRSIQVMFCGYQRGMSKDRYSEWWIDMPLWMKAKIQMPNLSSSISVVITDCISSCLKNINKHTTLDYTSLNECWNSIDRSDSSQMWLYSLVSTSKYPLVKQSLQKQPTTSSHFNHSYHKPDPPRDCE